MFNVFDIAILVITVGLAFAGFREGLVRGVIKLAGLVATIILFAMLSGEIYSLAELVPALPHEIVVPLTFGLLFICAMIAFHFAAELLYRVVHMTPAGFIDSGLGTALGMVKALVLGGILAMLLAFSPPGTFLNSQYHKSRTATPLRRFLSETIPFVMDAGRSIYERYSDSIGTEIDYHERYNSEEFI